MVAQEPDPPDEPAGRELLRGPVGEAVVQPAAAKALDLVPGALEVERLHVLEEVRLGVDRGERLGVLVAPLPEQEALGADLRRDHPAPSIRSSSVRAPALSSGSFRFPHFGLWTHEGQPRSHGQPASSFAVSAVQPSNAS